MEDSILAQCPSFHSRFSRRSAEENVVWLGAKERSHATSFVRRGGQRGQRSSVHVEDTPCNFSDWGEGGIGD